MLKPPGAIRCKPGHLCCRCRKRRPTTFSRTELTNAAASPAAAVRCKQPNGTKRQPLSTNKMATSTNEKQPTPFALATQQRGRTPSEGVKGSGPATPAPSEVSKDDTSKEGMTPMASLSLVREWTGFSPRDKHNRIDAPS
jgi:hypothetical protein